MIENGNPTRSPPEPKGQEGVPVRSAVSKDVWAFDGPLVDQLDTQNSVGTHLIGG